VKRKSDSALDVGKVMKEFREAEEFSTHRKGTFKIDKPFEEALETLLRSKPKAKTDAIVPKKHYAPPDLLTIL